MKLRLNVKGKVIHGPECGESCNLDDADEVRSVSFTAASHLRWAEGWAVCDRFDPVDDRRDDESTPRS